MKNVVIRSEKVKNVRIPRFYLRDALNNKATLHIFCDASKKAFASVAYWRFESSKDEPARVVLIGAKSRVAPVKPLTIPRLELQAALLASRFAKTIEHEHEIKIERRYFWLL